mgnify:FL=1
MSEPAEGWYADPSGANQLRWWDGHAWTDYVEPYEAPVPSPQEVEVAVPAVDEAFPASSAGERTATSAGTPIPMPEAPLPQEVAPASSVAQTQVAPIPMPASPIEEKGSDEADAPERSGTLKWVLACAASWMLVAVFITVLVIAWSHLGASGRIQEHAKSRAETAQNELNTARSTLESINQQLQEATK